MTTFKDLENAQYVALETYRKDGTAVVTPLWQTFEGDTMYMWTQADSWKVKRIRHTSKVRVCESDARGTPLSDWVDAHAQVLDSKVEEATQRKRMAKKYGLFFYMFRLASLFTRKAYVALAIKES